MAPVVKQNITILFYLYVAAIVHAHQTTSYWCLPNSLDYALRFILRMTQKQTGGYTQWTRLQWDYFCRVKISFNNLVWMMSACI